MIAGWLKPAWLALAATSCLGSTAMAQAPMRFHGVVVAFSGTTLTVRTDDETLMATIPPGLPVGAVTNRSLADVRPGEFVGSAAVLGRDGKLHAQEVHIFPEAQRGAGEGHRAMEQPEQSMTNATVDGVAEAPDGRTLHLRYAGGEQTIEVGPDVRVVGLVPGDRSLLVPGAAVTIRAVPGAGDDLTAVSVQAEKDGVKPLP